MSVTIHYSGKLDDRARLAEMLDAARLYCVEQRWMYRDVDEEIVGQVERLVQPTIAGAEAGSVEPVTELVPIEDTLAGILIIVHPKADPVWFTLNAAGELARYMPLNDAGEFWEVKALSVATGSVGMMTHIAVCELLHFLKDEYFPGLSVYDELGYFESGDVLRASNAMEEAEAGTDSIEEASTK